MTAIRSGAASATSRTRAHSGGRPHQPRASYRSRGRRVRPGRRASRWSIEALLVRELQLLDDEPLFLVGGDHAVVVAGKHAHAVLLDEPPDLQRRLGPGPGVLI